MPWSSRSQLYLLGRRFVRRAGSSLAIAGDAAGVVGVSVLQVIGGALRRAHVQVARGGGNEELGIHRLTLGRWVRDGRLQTRKQPVRNLMATLIDVEQAKKLIPADGLKP